MRQTEYAEKRYPLEKERLRLLNLLESQGDFPDPKLIEALENNKKQIIEIDNQYSFVFNRYRVPNKKTSDQK